MSKITNNNAIWDEEHSGRRRVCMLMITHACNLNCSYCYESHKRNAYMTVELAKEIISKEAQFVAESDSLSAEDAEHAQTAITAYKVLKELDLTTSGSPYQINI